MFVLLVLLLHGPAGAYLMDHTHPSSTTALLQAGQKQKRKGGGGGWVAAGMSLTENTCGDRLIHSLIAGVEGWGGGGGGGEWRWI